ncbi:MAG: AAA family ATPase [Sandarakinorhabdus sp.]|nr:AAA family ATPase [Sandarakinorhabdus sp.]
MGEYRPPAPSDFLSPAKVARFMRAADMPATANRDEDSDVIDVGDWEGRPVPEREWIVRDWLLPRAVTLLAGKGGTGKSLLVQQWLSAISVGADFMGTRPAAPVGCLYVNCEDETDELHRRQIAISNAMRRSVGGFAGQMHLIPRMGRDNGLGTFDEGGKFEPSALFNRIASLARQRGCRVVALDNAMQMFVGNPNDNGEVTRFLNAVARLALHIDGAVILVAHTAKSDGSEFMGCMAWENACRTRLYLTREIDDDGIPVDGSERRTLSRNKANQAAIGDRLEMEWHAGAFQPVDRAGNSGRASADEAAFLACLDAATEVRRATSHNPGVNYAPRVFAAMPEAGKRSVKALTGAMQQLIGRGVIEVGMIAAIEVKASATVKASDFSGLRALAEACGDRFAFGVVLYDSTDVVPFGDRLAAAPLSCLWA